MTNTVIMGLLSSIFIPIAVAAALRFSVERIWPVTPVRSARDGLNIIAFLILYTALLLASPVLGVIATWATNHFGGGVIVLPANGWAQVGGFLIYFLAADLALYWFHRVTHVIPWLWSMHSLHHADTALDSTTSVLHHWVLVLIGSVVVGVPMGLLFKVPPTYLAINSVLSYYGYVTHANVRLDFGRFAWLICSPSYHRVHHSALPEHFDCNYAATFPIFDVIFGTYRPARPGEWPRVGLGDGGEPLGVFDILFWPVREFVRAWVKRPLGVSNSKT